MDTPTEKKLSSYVIYVLIFIAGLVIGIILASYLFFLLKDKILLLNQSPKINTTLTENQIQKVASLEQNKTIFGKVILKDASSFTLQISIVNPLDTKNSTTTSIKIPFDQSNEVIIIKQVPATPSTSSIKTTTGSFSDLKVGQFILVKILDGKKTIYISS
ncbi:MAG: hypothetical protein Q7S34_01225 [bacterium]|nr:hypothetical protein [bacterium]